MGGCDGGFKSGMGVSCSVQAAMMNRMSAVLVRAKSLIAASLPALAMPSSEVRESGAAEGHFAL